VTQVQDPASGLVEPHTAGLGPYLEYLGYYLLQTLFGDIFFLTSSLHISFLKN